MADTSKNCYNFSIHLKFYDFGRLYLVTKVLLDLDRFYSILATIQYFKRWKSAIMDQFMTFRKRVYSACYSSQNFLKRISHLWSQNAPNVCCLYPLKSLLGVFSKFQTHNYLLVDDSVRQLLYSQLIQVEFREIWLVNSQSVNLILPGKSIARAGMSHGYIR